MGTFRKLIVGALGTTCAALLMAGATTVYAADPTPENGTVTLKSDGLYQGTTELKDGSDDHWSFENGILTLDGFNFTTSASPAFEIVGTATIYTTGTNSISTTGTKSSVISATSPDTNNWDGSIAVYHHGGDLTFDGSGDLTLTSASVAGGSGSRNTFALLSEKSNIFFKSGNITMTSGNSEVTTGYVSALFVHNSDITMTGGNLEVIGYGANKASGGDAANAAYGMTLDGYKGQTIYDDFTFSGGSFTMRGRTSAVEYWGSEWNIGGDLKFTNPFMVVTAENMAGENAQAEVTDKSPFEDSTTWTSAQRAAYADANEYISLAMPGTSTEQKRYPYILCPEFVGGPKVVLIPYGATVTYDEWNSFIQSNYAGMNDTTYRFLGFGAPSLLTTTSGDYKFTPTTGLTTKVVNGHTYKGYNGKVQLQTPEMPSYKQKNGKDKVIAGTVNIQIFVITKQLS